MFWLYFFVFEKYFLFVLLKLHRENFQKNFKSFEKGVDFFRPL